MSLIDSASRISVEISRELDTLTSIKKKLRDQLCRLQVEERALRELLVCEAQPILQTADTSLQISKYSTNQPFASNSNEDEANSVGSDRALTPNPYTPEYITSPQRVDVPIDDNSSSLINSQKLNLDANIVLLCSYQKSLLRGDRSSSGREEIDTSCDENMNNS